MAPGIASLQQWRATAQQPARRRGPTPSHLSIRVGRCGRGLSSYGQVWLPSINPPGYYSNHQTPPNALTHPHPTHPPLTPARNRAPLPALPRDAILQPASLLDAFHSTRVKGYLVAHRVNKCVLHDTRAGAPMRCVTGYTQDTTCPAPAPTGRRANTQCRLPSVICYRSISPPGSRLRAYVGHHHPVIIIPRASSSG